MNAPVTPAYPLTYSGYGGVVSSGVQVGSAAVAGLPSVSASLMAVIGRHKPYRYLACQTEMSAGGGPGSPNWAPLRSIKGRTAPSHGTAMGRSPGGVGRQTPGAGARVNRTGAFRPSCALAETSVLAARSPYAMPRSFAGPAGTLASDAAYAVSRMADWEGT